MIGGGYDNMGINQQQQEPYTDGKTCSYRQQHKTKTMKVNA